MRPIATVFVAALLGGCAAEKAETPPEKEAPAPKGPATYDGWTEGKPGQYCIDRSKLGKTSPGCPTEIPTSDTAGFPKLMGRLKANCEAGPLDVPGVPSVGKGYVTEASGDRCCYSFECIVVPGG